MKQTTTGGDICSLQNSLKSQIPGVHKTITFVSMSYESNSINLNRNGLSPWVVNWVTVEALKTHAIMSNLMPYQPWKGKYVLVTLSNSFPHSSMLLFQHLQQTHLQLYEKTVELFVSPLLKKLYLFYLSFTCHICRMYLLVKTPQRRHSGIDCEADRKNKHHTLTLLFHI